MFDLNICSIKEVFG